MCLVASYVVVARTWFVATTGLAKKQSLIRKYNKLSLEIRRPLYATQPHYHLTQVFLSTPFRISAGPGLNGEGFAHVFEMPLCAACTRTPSARTNPKSHEKQMLRIQGRMHFFNKYIQTASNHVLILSDYGTRKMLQNLLYLHNEYKMLVTKQ